jgi:transcriptional regulator with XRE-family HTH domain
VQILTRRKWEKVVHFAIVSPMARAASVDPESVPEIGRRLRLTREAMGMTQAAFCRLIGIDTPQWNNYEKGLRRISPDPALQLCRVTGVSMDWIYRGIPNQLPADLAAKIARLDERERKTS